MLQPRNIRKTRVGTVTSASAEKTITVAVERKVKHPLYGKFVRKTSKILAHDPDSASRVGDTVQVMETRPLSRRKRWCLLRKIDHKQA